MVLGTSGLEPETCGLKVQRSDQLSYTPINAERKPVAFL
jgi:hypothetical protein